MNYKILLAAAAVALATVPGNAVEFVVNAGSRTAIPNTNDFKANLASLGLNAYTSTGASVALNGRGRVTFEFLGSESGFTDTFTSGTATFTENPDSNRFNAPIAFGGSQVFDAGAFTAQFTSNQGLPASIGSDGFGIFLPQLNTGSPYTSNVLYFGYDDQITNVDDNHDDFILRATVGAVPEPTTWAMLIAGFGFVGYALRSRRRVNAVVAA